MGPRFATALFLVLAGQEPALPPIGIVDFYGLRVTSAEAARQALGISRGDTLPSDEDLMRERLEAARSRLRGLPGVTAAEVRLVCCDEGRAILYVGIAEDGVPPASFRPAPTGAARLPEDVVAAGAAVDRAIQAAVRAGRDQEDQEEGHSLMRDPAARAAQQRFVPLAARDRERLREVLKGSADAEQRALAAEVLAYSVDKAAAAADLVEAASDPDPGVRNNAMRALVVMAAAPALWPGGVPRIPTAPLIPRLRSLDWSDRNKASLLLSRLTAGRDESLLASLAREVFPELVEMARWTVLGHAVPALVILGRIAGSSEDEIGRAIGAGDREALIAAAARAAGVGVRRPATHRRPIDDQIGVSK